MNKAGLIELIRNLENSGVDFKRDDVSPEKMAGEIVGLLNLTGDTSCWEWRTTEPSPASPETGKTQKSGVMEVARTHVQPATIPYGETIDWDTRDVVGIISLSADAPDKPYKAKRGSVWVTKIRVGTTKRDATREERMPTPGRHCY